MSFLDPTNAAGYQPNEPSSTPIYNPISTIANALPMVPGLGPNIAPTLNPSAPSQANSFSTKYANPQVRDAVNSLPDALKQSLIQMDTQRVAQGQSPLTKDETLSAVQQLQNPNQQVTPAPTPNPYTPVNFAKNAVSDLKNITMNIPRIPLQMLHEVQDIGNIGTQMNQAHSIADYAKLPGIRLLPGAFTVGNLAGGMKGIQNEVSHPLMSALDILPFAEAKVFAPGEAAARTAAEAGTEAASRSAIDLARESRPGQIAGGVANNAIDAFNRSRPGQLVQEAFGGQARQLSMENAVANARLQDQLNPESTFDYKSPDVDMARQLTGLSAQFKSTIPASRQQELVSAITQPDLPGNPIDSIPGINDAERGFLQKYQDVQQRVAQYHIDQGTLQNIDGEIYDRDTANRINNASTDRQRAQIIANSPPARFIPLLQKKIAEGYKVISATDNNIDNITRAVGEGTFAQFPDAADRIAQLTKEVTPTWQTMREAGYDPVFMHNVTPGRVSAAEFPKVLDYVPDASQLEKRAMDITPSASSFSVALDHQALELLNQTAARNFIGRVSELFGRTESDVRAELMPLAQRMAEGDPRLNVAGHLDRLVQRQYTPVTEESLLSGAPFRMSEINNLSDVTMLPRTVYNNINRMRMPMKNGFTAAMDPIMKVFRTSVLPFSVRWHFNNLFGNMIMLTGQTGPDVFKYMSNAVDMMKSGETMLNGEKVALPEYLRLQMRSSTAIQREADLAASGTMSRIIDQIESARAAGKVPGISALAQGADAGIGKIGGALGKVAEKSYAYQSFVDDAMRSMGYLYGYDKALTKGMTREAAEAAGEQVARRAFQTWGELTPIERSIMRYAFPFYGFTQHILRYSMRYPFEHPFRTAVLSSFADAEQTDHSMDGLPSKFLNGFFIGGMDKDGNVKQVSLSGMNPFRDVANYFTLTGLIGQSNPIAKTIMEEMGINTQTGAPDLYPNLEYDSETGRLAVKPPNPLDRLIANTLPQSQILTGIASSGSEFRQLMKSNPDAAARLLRSQAGLPVLFRNVNVPQEQVKAELAREKSQQGALKDALKTGNDTQANEYADLNPMLDQIRAMQSSGQLDEFQQQGNAAPTPLQLAQNALIKMNVPG